MGCEAEYAAMLTAKWLPDKAQTFDDAKNKMRLSAVLEQQRMCSMDEQLAFVRYFAR